MTTLTNQGYMGLGIYLGFKASYRRGEMLTFRINYDDVVTELTRYGIIKSGRIVKSKAREVWEERFKGILPSQTHRYNEVLGFKRTSY